MITFYDYIESTGKQIINSGVTPTVKPRIVAEFAVTDTTIDKDLFGTGALLGNKKNTFFVRASRLYMQVYYSNSDYAIVAGISDSDYHKWDISDKVYLDGELKYTFTNAFSQLATIYPIGIFGAIRDTSRLGYMRLRYCKMYDGDTLVRHFVPAGDGTKYGLYDLLEGKFYKDIRGNSVPFLVGEEVTPKIMVRSNNLFKESTDGYSYDSSKGVYGNWGRLPNGTYTLSVELKDNSIVIPNNNCYFGITADGATAGHVYWLISNDEIKNSSRTFIVTDDDTSLKYLTFYDTPNLSLFLAKYRIILVKGDTAMPYRPYMSPVKTIAWGVKDECKIVLDGTEKWALYGAESSNWRGAYITPPTNAKALRVAQYNNYWGYTAYAQSNKYLWVGTNAIYIAWQKGSPPFPSWETKDANGKAIANIPQIKADLAKKNLVVYYDNTSSKPKTLAGLLKIVRRQISAVYKGNTLLYKGEPENRFHYTFDSLVVGGSYGFWGPLSDGTYTIKISLKDANDPLPTGANYYFGLHSTNNSSTGVLKWLVSAGEIVQSELTYTISSSQNDPMRYFAYQTPQKEYVDTFLSKVNIILTKDA